MVVKRKGFIRYLALMTALMLALAPLAFAAADDGEEDELFPGFYAENPFAESSVCTWQDIGASKNAGLPVYSAPFPEAFRPANGKAILGTGSPFTLLGTLQDRTWAMVEYDIDRARSRVGWIELPAQAPQRKAHYDLDLNRRPAVIKSNTALTDDPRKSGAALTVLEAGRPVIAMSVCTIGELPWVYVEAEAEGRVCWGFVLAQAVSIMPEDSLYRVEDGQLIIADGVSAVGYAFSYDDDDGNSHGIRVNPGEFFLGGIDLMPLQGVRGITFPDSLRHLGGEALFYGDLETLRLDGRLTSVNPWFSFGCDVEEMILASDYVQDFPRGEHSSVRRWTVEPGNPCYSSRDGVLFSADGKILLSYPDGREDTHYDVPRGTEEIGDAAFDSDDNLPLKTISLPIGLKRIGRYAFCGCGRLVSLAVPLTVTDLDPSAFEDCVSLERLSLPPGLQAEFDGNWAEHGDFTYFNGDNGSTLAREKPPEEWETSRDRFRSYAVYLDNPEGAGDVTLYSTSDGDEVAAVRKAGDRTRVLEIRDGRARVPAYDWNWDKGIPDNLWVPLANTRPDFGNVLFTISDAVLKDPAILTPAGDPLAFYYESDGELAFFSGRPDEDETVYFPCDAAVLYRDGPDDGRTMGILFTGSSSIPLYDAPEGEQTGHLYSLTQALMLEERGEWRRIRTADREGWIPAAFFLPVLPRNNP